MTIIFKNKHGPETTYSANELEAGKAYVDENGEVFIGMDPGLSSLGITAVGLNGDWIVKSSSMGHYWPVVLNVEVMGGKPK